MSVPDRFPNGRLWSLWEMIEKHGHLFTVATAYLSEAKWLCLLAGMSLTDPVSPEVVRVSGNEAVHAVRQASIMADMDDLLPEIDRLQTDLNRSSDALNAHQISAIGQALKHLIARVKDALDGEFFFHVDGRDVPLYKADEPFGPDVTLKFPLAAEDIAEAAKCLALQRSTACVFHLMRVMEIALRALAVKLKVTSIDPNVENWNKITDHVNKALNTLPAKTAAEHSRKAKMGAVIAHLNSVRVAWRNEVMHPKQSYSREEAHTIFAAVRVFMIDLAVLK